MKKTRKGFTIVELIIVIAVVAVLTAILVPTFIHLTKKANEAADHSLVTNLNKALAMREAEEGDKGKNMTMHDCVLDLEKEGYKLPQLTTRAEEDRVWSQKANRFFLSSDYKEVEHGGKFNCWHIYEQMPTTEEWGIYPNEDKWTTTDVTVTKVGFDAGRAAVGTVKFATGEAANVVVRTNGGKFTVDAPNATVSHYADVDKVAVDRIAGASYHEFGRVASEFSIKSGHAVVEPNGYVNELAIPSSATGVSVEVKSEGTVETAVNDSGSATVEIAQGAEVNQYVGDTTNVSGSGSQTVKENAITKTHVDNEDDLITALANDKYIAIDKNIDQTKLIYISRSVVIDGQGHLLKSTAKAANRNLRINASDVNVQIKNLNIDCARIVEDVRAVQVDSNKANVSLLLDNVTGINAKYAVNICGGTTNLDLRIVDSTFSGYGAVNLWGESYTVNITNSTLIGHNDASYNADGWNDFSALILEGDTTARTDEHANDIDVRLLNSTIKATTKGQGNTEWCILFNTPSTHNNVYADGCTFVYDHAEKTKLVLGTNATNHFFENGVEKFDD